MPWNVMTQYNTEATQKFDKKNSQSQEPVSCFPSFYQHAFQLLEVEPVLLQVLVLLFPYEAVGFSFVRILQQAAFARLLQLSSVILTFLIPPHVPKDRIQQEQSGGLEAHLIRYPKLIH
uniref:Uncharacterized protein n=1 Tax=Cucumis melo TaxID=3656 RepID=A0A9I9EM43_CUCME